MNKQKEGWGKPTNSKKWHYFIDGMALCGKWGFYRGPLEPDDGESPDDCKACRRKLENKQ
jgi:hypothetical protein